ncbi:hypothetical protein BJ165DRAFT_682524 [Panaeolus papilionaceus]|nr:hypothetical protein BJ165DRAFT_682524 [Panaeolus papilionaceus]
MVQEVQIYKVRREFVWYEVQVYVRYDLGKGDKERRNSRSPLYTSDFMSLFGCNLGLVAPSPSCSARLPRIHALTLSISSSIQTFHKTPARDYLCMFPAPCASKRSKLHFARVLPLHISHFPWVLQAFLGFAGTGLKIGCLSWTPAFSLSAWSESTDVREPCLEVKDGTGTRALKCKKGSGDETPLPRMGICER